MSSILNELYEAIEEGKVKIIKEVLAKTKKNKVDIDKKSKYKMSPISWAIKFKRYNVIKWLVAVGADINSKVYTHTPLSYSAFINDAAAIPILVKLRADVNLKNKTGRVPMDYAHSAPVITALLKAGANLEDLCVSSEFIEKKDIVPLPNGYLRILKR